MLQLCVLIYVTRTFRAAFPLPFCKRLYNLCSMDSLQEIRPSHTYPHARDSQTHDLNIIPRTRITSRSDQSRQRSALIRRIPNIRVSKRQSKCAEDILPKGHSKHTVRVDSRERSCRNTYPARRSRTCVPLTTARGTLLRMLQQEGRRGE
jgi:hypothetical protein